MVPDEILKRIRILAAKERRSMNSEMLIVIEGALLQKISFDSAATGTGFSGNVPLLRAPDARRFDRTLWGMERQSTDEGSCCRDCAPSCRGGGEGEALS